VLDGRPEGWVEQYVRTVMVNIMNETACWIFLTKLQKPIHMELESKWPNQKVQEGKEGARIRNVYQIYAKIKKFMLIKAINLVSEG
jgi:hypothetical protein